MGVGRPNAATRRATSISGALSLTFASTGPSAETYNLGAPTRLFTIQAEKLVKGAGGPTGLNWRLQGSMNGTDWHNLIASVSQTTASATMTNSTANHAVLYIRGNSTAKTGGTGGVSTLALRVGALNG